MRAFLVAFLLVLLPYGVEGTVDQNALIVTDNGIEMFHWCLDFVREAKESVEVATAVLGGTIARALFSVIENRIKEVPELQVYILSPPTLLENEDWQMIAHLQKTYPNNFHIEFASTVAIIWPDVSGTDNHIKMFVIDEKYFALGGTNLDESACSEGTWTPPKNYKKPPIFSNNLPAGMRDQDIVGRGSLAKELRVNFHMFYALWESYNKRGIFEKNPEKFSYNNHYFPLTHPATVEKFDSAQKHALNSNQIRIILGGPHQMKSEITQEYVRLIEGAKEEIILSHMYFCPVDPILQALMGAVNRGVKLTLLTNGVSEIAPEYTQYFCWANRIHYVPLFYGKTFHFWDGWSIGSLPIKNTRIFEYNVRDILLHKKVMIVDGEQSIVGSYNLGYRSDMGDYELVVAIDSKDVSNALKKVHERDISYSREVTAAEARYWYFDPVKVSLGELQKRFHGLL